MTVQMPSDKPRQCKDRCHIAFISELRVGLKKSLLHSDNDRIVLSFVIQLKVESRVQDVSPTIGKRILFSVFSFEC
jgi:hypothetical protein